MSKETYYPSKTFNICLFHATYSLKKTYTISRNFNRRLRHFKRDLRHFKRDLRHFKRDLRHFTNDLTPVYPTKRTYLKIPTQCHVISIDTTLFQKRPTLCQKRPASCLFHKNNSLKKTYAMSRNFK